MDKKIQEEYQQNWMILRVTTHERIKCTKHDLDTIYSLTDLLDFIEDIEVLAAIDESAQEKQEAERQKQQIKNKGR